MSSIKDVEEVMKRVRHLCANIVDPDQTCYKYSFVTFFFKREQVLCLSVYQLVRRCLSKLKKKGRGRGRGCKFKC